MGSVQLNRLRLLVALGPLLVTLWIVRGAPWPGIPNVNTLLLMAASGVVGFAIADSYYFRALVILGTGRTALLLATAPVFTAIFARWWMDERLGARALAGMAMTLAGLGLVLGDRRQATAPHREGSAAAGVACGVFAAICAAAGYVLSRLALTSGIDPLSATTLRVAAALVVVWMVAIPRGGWAPARAALRDRFATRMMIAGALCGPFLGVTLSLVALQRTQAAGATSIFAISPLVALGLGVRFHGEPLSARIGAGALLAIAGVITLFTRH
jgi:drug/metabolite transporter (DMT)-like permease